MTLARPSALAAGLSLCLGAEAAYADGPLGAQGTPIATSKYSVDLFQGPLTASNRVTGLAGAVAPIADGLDMHAFNAASPAVRTLSSASVTEFDVSAGVTFPSALRQLDFDNNGTRGFTYDNFVFVTLAAQVQEGQFGLGATVDIQQYSLGSTGAESVSSVAFRLIQPRILAAATIGEELHVGGGIRAVVFTLRDAAVSGLQIQSFTDLRSLLTMAGFGPEVGALWAPRKLPMRLGVSLRSPVSGRVLPDEGSRLDASGDRKIGRLYLPERVEVPWQIEWGVAVQLGPRPFNAPWLDSRHSPRQEVESYRKKPDEPRSTVTARMGRRLYEKIPREKFLLSFSFTVTGPTPSAVGLESFLAGKVDRSGEKISFTPRIGVETEALPDWVVFRAGSYLEPTRFREATSRLHGTFGVELKTLSWDIFGLYEDPLPFRVGGSLDVAREYFSWGLTAGIWR